MRSNRGFTLVEVLVASIILFLSIVTVTLAYKQYESYRLKQEKYENIYINVISLTNKILSKNIVTPSFEETGKINGIAYKIMANMISSKRNYVYGFSAQSSGNKGNFMLKLYKVTIQIYNSTFTFYKTEFIKVL